MPRTGPSDCESDLSPQGTSHRALVWSGDIASVSGALPSYVVKEANFEFSVLGGDSTCQRPKWMARPAESTRSLS